MIGIVAVPFVLMWGVTGAAFELPAVENAWLTITGGTSVNPDRYTFMPNPASGAGDIGLDQAVSTALQRHPGDIRYVSLPAEDAAYYSVSISGSYAPYNARAFFGGDVFVDVDAHDASHGSVADGGEAELLANTFALGGNEFLLPAARPGQEPSARRLHVLVQRPRQSQ